MAFCELAASVELLARLFHRDAAMWVVVSGDMVNDQSGEKRNCCERDDEEHLKTDENCGAVLLIRIVRSTKANEFGTKVEVTSLYSKVALKLMNSVNFV